MIKTDKQKSLLAQKQANNKNPQFLPNQADIQAILSTHELVIFTKFHNNWMKIVDFYYQPIFGPVNFLFNRLQYDTDTLQDKGMTY